MCPSDSIFRQALEKLDDAHAGDTSRQALNYARRMAHWLRVLEPGASVALRLAAYSQHLRRWEIPRNTFPDGREGYLNWRKTLYRFHADQAAQILQDVGCDQTLIDRVGALLRKEKLKTDPEMQTLEDVICLVFLENQFSDFASGRDAAQMTNIIRRTWLKMSPKGRTYALQLPLAAKDSALIAAALRQPPALL